ncbi:Glycine cleavage system H protein (lipoate-binding) [Mariniphaga anaerophila]|uniref:Glycine cleavage system H protein (Lipoate-binding) n=1 Tax=Mariniphaga anaerophila TaxID=1484053 RepID=A0A1M4YUX4_9BACT|nr:hypothetical protein [Mariniphaga anaerophila]SHF09302.1 Glycine cleavage system H protein (lipoate-binding) [Mariniphaga anaerophila]
MKTILSSLLILLVIPFLVRAEGTDNESREQALGNNEMAAQVYSSPETVELVKYWISGFEESNPDAKINVAEMSDGLRMSDDQICFSSGVSESDPSWKIVVGHDIIVPVFNAENPWVNALKAQGVTSKTIGKMLSQKADWTTIFDGATKTPIRVFIADSEPVVARLLGFAGVERGGSELSVLVPVSELVSKVQNDKYAVGFCRLADVLNSEMNSFAGQIAILPVDKNENGKIDGFENIFGSPQALIRGAWVGKYPRELCADIYAFSSGQPQNNAALEFLNWVINDGQELLGAQGFSNLSGREKASGMLALTKPVSGPAPAGSSPGLPSGTIFLFAAVAVMLALAIIYFLRKQNTSVLNEEIEVPQALNVNSVEAPGGLFYDKTYTWAFMEKDGQVKIGINDFLQHITGTLTQVKMKAPGEKVRKGEKIFSIVREGKQLEIFSPISGSIKQYNEELLTCPEKLNRSPYSDGWVYQVEPANWLRETRFMFMADQFKEWLDDEFVRLKDFLATSANSKMLAYNHVVLQDGGELTDNVLAELDPEVWEDFQKNFLS